MSLGLFGLGAISQKRLKRIANMDPREFFPAFARLKDSDIAWDSLGSAAGQLALEQLNQKGDRDPIGIRLRAEGVVDRYFQSEKGNSVQQKNKKRQLFLLGVREAVEPASRCIRLSRVARHKAFDLVDQKRDVAPEDYLKGLEELGRLCDEACSNPLPTVPGIASRLGAPGPKGVKQVWEDYLCRRVGTMSLERVSCPVFYDRQVSSARFWYGAMESLQHRAERGFWHPWQREALMALAAELQGMSAGGPEELAYLRAKEGVREHVPITEDFEAAFSVLAALGILAAYFKYREGTQNGANKVACLFLRGALEGMETRLREGCAAKAHPFYIPHSYSFLEESLLAERNPYEEAHGIRDLGLKSSRRGGGWISRLIHSRPKCFETQAHNQELLSAAKAVTAEAVLILKQKWEESGLRPNWCVMGRHFGAELKARLTKEGSLVGGRLDPELIKGVRDIVEKNFPLEDLSTRESYLTFLWGLRIEVDPGGRFEQLDRYVAQVTFQAFDGADSTQEGRLQAIEELGRRGARFYMDPWVYDPFYAKEGQRGAEQLQILWEMVEGRLLLDAERRVAFDRGQLEQLRIQFWLGARRELGGIIRSSLETEGQLKFWEEFEQELLAVLEADKLTQEMARSQGERLSWPRDGGVLARLLNPLGSYTALVQTGLAQGDRRKEDLGCFLLGVIDRERTWHTFEEGVMVEIHKAVLDAIEGGANPYFSY